MPQNQSASELVQMIKAEAFSLGFCLFGVTDAQPPMHYADYENWLEAGLNGRMEYLTSERHRGFRRDPGLLLEGTKSIVVLGWPYPLTVPDAAKSNGLIAGYAGEQDYHILLPGLMQQLVVFIRQTGVKSFNAKCVTDSAPVLERELGQRAGLGWIGKNSSLISPEIGSAFLLSEIFLTLDLPSSRSFSADRCGTCRRCIESCPTGCIRPDRTLDAGKCISYLTIENKGSIPPELREEVGNWVFGCDICQVVCPWNKKAIRRANYQAKVGKLSREEMVTHLTASGEEFTSHYRESPVLRAKQRGLLRNLIVVLANLGETKAIPVFKQLLAETVDEEKQELLHWALSKLA